jgi:hypothetical protein
MENLNFELDYMDYEPLEIELVTPDSFLKVRETLTRMGIYSKRTNTLWQSCHILQKGGKYYIVHFKELFALSGKPTNLVFNDIERRNRIAKLLTDWGLIKIVTGSQLDYMSPVGEISIISYKDKSKYNLRTKYAMQTEIKERQKAKST